jgi:hypothetical protein
MSACRVAGWLAAFALVLAVVGQAEAETWVLWVQNLTIDKLWSKVRDVAGPAECAKWAHAHWLGSERISMKLSGAHSLVQSLCLPDGIHPMDEKWSAQ